jgi:hypothetical protein
LKTINLSRSYPEIRLLSALILLLGLALSVFGEAVPVRADAANGFANDAFQTAWQALDGPVASGQAARPYLWGPAGGAVLDEPYKESKGGKRQVQYFAKGRMELTYADTQPDFTGNGRLVVELVTGRLQVGENSYLQFAPDEAPVAGGNLFATNPGAPSYRAFQSLLLPNRSQVGLNVTSVLTIPEGEGYLLGFYSLARDNALATLVKNQVYVAESGHNIPDVFWSYLNQGDSNGIPLFNWQTLFGLPLTDAYWAKVRGAAGEPQDILVQLFERRTLLYNPAAAPGFQVESGDVGADYYRWRYQLPELPVVEDQVEPSSGPGAVQPAVGEAGAIFTFTGSNFKPGESTSAWVEELGTTAGPNAAPGIFPQPVTINGEGQFRLRLSTQPLLTPSLLIRVVVIGNDSGTKVVLNARVIGSTRYTPGAELAQPTDVPPAISAKLESTILKAGDTARVEATGFTPGEEIRSWLTTSLNRVSGSASRTKPFADSSGTWKATFSLPESPAPGIYAFTMYGMKSGHTAIVYFRVRAGSLLVNSPFLLLFDLLGSLTDQPVVQLENQTGPKWQLVQDNE